MVIFLIEVYTGNPISVTSLLASAIGGTGFDATKGQTYYICVDGLEGWEGSFNLNLTESTIAITSPSPGAQFQQGEPIVLSASTTHIDGSSKDAFFYAGTNFVGSAKRKFKGNATLVWTNAPPGMYSLVAITKGPGNRIWYSHIEGIQVHPLNDDFANALPLTGLNIVTNGTDRGAGMEAGELSPASSSADASVWYSWTPTVSGEATVGIEEANVEGHPFGVYVGDSIQSLTALGESVFSFYPIQFEAHAGARYYIDISGFSSRASDPFSGGESDYYGAFALTINQVPAPSNDDLANATLLVGSSMVVTGSNIGATTETGDPLVNSVWWDWRAPTNGRLTLDFTGSSFIPAVLLYTGSTLTNLVPVTQAWGTAGYNYQVDAGQVYHIGVGSSLAYAPTGAIAMSLNFTPAPENDSFTNRIQLEGVLSSWTGSNYAASVEPGENSGLASTVWFTWTAPKSGPTDLGAPPSRYPGGYSPALGVYTGSEVTNLVLVTNGFSGLQFQAIQGTEYQIAVGANDQVGDIRLALAQGPPPNGDFTNRIVLAGTNVSVVGTSTGAPSIWYTWSAPASGILSLDFTGDTFLSELEVFTGLTSDTLAAAPSTPRTPVGEWEYMINVTVQQGEQLQILGYPYSPAHLLFLELSFVPSP